MSVHDVLVREVQVPSVCGSGIAVEARELWFRP